MVKLVTKKASSEARQRADRIILCADFSFTTQNRLKKSGKYAII